MIKNWTVISKVVKNGSVGVMKREAYIMSRAHPNHKKTIGIVSLIGNSETTNKIALAGEEYRLRQCLMQKKGGRPLATYAMEFCLSLPKSIHATPEQWRKIVIDCGRFLMKKLVLNEEEKRQFANQIRAVLHQQDETSNDHVHLIVGKALKGRVLTELQKKATTSQLKFAYNAAVYRQLKVSPKDYEPKAKKYGKRLEMWRYSRAEENISKEAAALLRKLSTQVEKYFTAMEEEDEKQKKRQLNRIAKTLGELDSHTLPAKHQQTAKEISTRFKLK